MSSFTNKHVLITGGAGGIGLLMGKQALEAGASTLIIWDVSEQNIQAAKNKLQNFQEKLFCMQVDISDQEQIDTAAQDLLSQISHVDILVNNAGIVIGKSFDEYSAGEIDQSLAVNLRGALLVTRAFLPAMIQQGSGHIVNIASAAGLIANPKMSVYTAGKWGMIGWSESLRLELKRHHPDVKVTTVEPGYIKTGMFAGVKPPLLTPLLEPEKISRDIIRAVQKNKIILRKPFMVKLLPFLKGILPTRLFDFLAGKLFKVYSSMDTFTGRHK